MKIEMHRLFRYKVQQTSKFGAEQGVLAFEDPYEIRKWSNQLKIKPRELLANFAWYILRTLRLRVQHSVNTQQINGRSMQSLYKALSPHYKKKNPMSYDMFWRDTGTLIDSLTVWGEGENIYLGIPLSKKLKGSDTPVHMLYKYLEFGTKRNGKQHIPPRPLIHPNLQFIIKRIKEYFTHFIKLCFERKIILKRS